MPGNAPPPPLRCDGGILYTVGEPQAVGCAGSSAPAQSGALSRHPGAQCRISSLDYREMIKREKPGIVSVTTPSCARAEPIIFGAENGVRGIFSEKGLCPSPRDTSSP